MQELGYLHEELERWFTSYNKLYVQLVERHLAEAFTSYRPGQEGNFVRRCAPKLVNFRLVSITTGSAYLFVVLIYWWWCLFISY